MEDKKILYRGKISYGGNECKTSVYIEKQYVIKETEMSFMLSTYMYSKKGTKRILKSSVNSPRGYCAETEDFAMKQLYNRTIKRIDWFQYYLTTCKEAIKILDKKFNK